MTTTPDYTDTWGLPKPRSNNYIAAANSNLRLDIGALADKTDQQLSTVRAETLSEAHNAVEVARQTWDVPASRRLTSANDLNDLIEPGRYSSYLTSVTSDPALHYPPGSIHGYLSVVQLLPGTAPYVHQSWVDTWVDMTASRRLYNGSWSEWSVIPADTAQQLTDHQALIDNLTARVADIEENSTTVDRYLWSRPDAWVADQDITWARPDGSTIVIPTTYKGEDYVGQLGDATNYSELLVTKAESTGTIDVSCLNPSTGRHVTYRIQGAWDRQTSLIDDFQRVEETWVGPYSGNEVSKETLVMPRSNIEWAMVIDHEGSKHWVPNHGTPTAYKARPTRFVDSSGNELDLSLMQVGDQITGLNGLKVYQSVYGRHPETGDVNWFRIDQTTTISPDGMIQSESVWTALRDVTLGANYAPMAPIMTGLVDKLHIQGGTTYDLDTTPPETTWYLPLSEGRSIDSVLFTSTTDDFFVATSFLEPQVSLLRNHPKRGTSNVARVESRDAGQLKLYLSGFGNGATVPAGTVWRFGAQWRYGETPNPSQYA